DEANSAGPAATVQQAAVQQAAQPTAVQPGVEPAGVQATAVQPAVQATTMPPTTVQPTTVQPTTVQPTTVQPAAAQPAAVQPTTVQPGVAGLRGGPADGPDVNGTQVLFLGEDAWAPGTPDPAAQASRYGYYRAQRRRRMWLASGLAAGTVVALAVI